jgi:hypothetical protein
MTTYKNSKRANKKFYKEYIKPGLPKMQSKWKINFKARLIYLIFALAIIGLIWVIKLIVNLF